VDTNRAPFLRSPSRMACKITCGTNAAIYCTHGQRRGAREEQVVYQDGYVKCSAGYQKEAKGENAKHERGVRRAFNAW
jgi:hypothetical protein